jgi:signal transduction histidine kinase
VRTRWTNPGATFADGLLAIAVAAIGVASVALTDTSAVVSGGPATSTVGPRPLIALVYALAGLALTFRRRSPLRVFAFVLVLLAVPIVVYGSSEGVGAFAAPLVALYTVGAHCERREALAALAAFTGFWLLLVARDPLNADLGDMLGSWPAYLLFVIVWLGGSYLRTRRLLLAELRYRAEQAEAAQAERLELAREDERARIARELHDAVAHSMTVMVMQAEAADEVFASDPEAARRAIGRVQNAGREGLVEMRRLVGILRDDDHAERVPQPGLGALPDLVETVRETGLSVDLRFEGTPGPLSAGADISAYRIVQEALTNVIKHAHATEAYVNVRYVDGVELEVGDNGRGSARPAGEGHGLVGMRERVALYGGTFRAGDEDGAGFRVTATLPAGAT